MNKIYSYLSNLSIYRKISKTPLPGWTILAMDIVTMMVSCLILIFADSYRINDASILSEGVTYLKYVYLIIVFVLVDLFTKNYQSIIRLSVLADLYGVFLTVLYTACILFISTFITANIFGVYNINVFTYWDIPMLSCISFSMLLVSRLGIKYAFMRIGDPIVTRKNAIIFGSALNSVVLASALSNETGGKFNPVALLSISGRKQNSEINGFPIEIYNPSDIQEIFERRHCDTLIFLDNQLEIMQNGYADKFLQNGIKLLNFNQVEEFGLNEETPEAVNLSTHITHIEIEDLLGRDPISPEKSLARAQIKGQCIMITGAAGSIGSELVRQVALYGASKIVLVDQAETPMHNMQLEMEEKFPGRDIVLFMGDITNYRRMELAFRLYRPKLVLHAAAYKHVPMMECNPTEAICTNVFGTKNLADLSLKYGVQKFVMISTDKAVNPTNIMGASKRIAEIYVQSLYKHETGKGNTNPTQFITTRFGNVLGSNGSVIPLFRKQIEKGGPVTITHKDIIRYFMTISEACSLVLEAGAFGKGGEVYIFDMGKPMKIYDLACRMISLAGLKVNKDIKIVETGLRPGEKLYEELLNDKEKTQTTINHKIMISKVQEYDYDEVCRNYEMIRKAAIDGDVHALVLAMKHFIPEYKSNNSTFVKIDREIEEEEAKIITINNN